MRKEIGRNENPKPRTLSSSLSSPPSIEKLNLEIRPKLCTSPEDLIIVNSADFEAFLTVRSGEKCLGELPKN